MVVMMLLLLGIARYRPEEPTPERVSNDDKNQAPSWFAPCLHRRILTGVANLSLKLLVGSSNIGHARAGKAAALYGMKRRQGRAAA
jgi:hypothetical protein